MKFRIAAALLLLPGLCAGAPAPQPSAAPSLAAILQTRRDALQRIGYRPPRTLEVRGRVTGADMNGSFERIVALGNERYTTDTGLRREVIVQTMTAAYVQNASGQVRRVPRLPDASALLARGSGLTLQGPQTLPGERSTYAIAASVNDSGVRIYVDTGTSMIDRVAYQDGAEWRTIDYYDYRVHDGALVPNTEFESGGDPHGDVARVVDEVHVNVPIAANAFDVPQSSVVATAKPVTVPLEDRAGHLFVRVAIRGRTYRFLLDSGAQGIVIDRRVASETMLVPIGQSLVVGTREISGRTVAWLDDVEIGGVRVPVRYVTIVNLSGATGDFDVDGILGSTFFEAAEVRLDIAGRTMTFAKPGTLPKRGTAVALDASRELPEVTARVDGASGLFLLDTGNSDELLLYSTFLEDHPEVASLDDREPIRFSGIGGSQFAARTHVGELQLGDFKIYNRTADAIPPQSGAFADRRDSGNIGLGILRDFTSTFDLADGFVYLDGSVRD